jgi:hypothetical protein
MGADQEAPIRARKGTPVRVHFECGSPSAAGHVLSRDGNYLIIDLDDIIELTSADGGGWCSQVGRDVDEVDAKNVFRRLR